MKIEITRNEKGNPTAKVEIDGYEFEIVGVRDSLGMTYEGTNTPEFMEFEESSDRNYEVCEKITDLLYELRY